jgi:DNA-binding transcriptional LysR family regulator
LEVFFAAVQCGSMGRAAARLGITQPSVSELITGLETTIGVRLFDRNSLGVEPTIYGQALLKRGIAAFDELKQGLRDLEFLANPTVGEIRIGCPDSVAATILPTMIGSFCREFPGVALRFDQVPTPTLDVPNLHARKLDVVIAWLSIPQDQFGDDLNVEILFNDQMVVAAGSHSRWARRRKIDLAELMMEPWILSGPTSWNYIELAEACRTRGIGMPKIRLDTISNAVRVSLLATGPYIATFPSSSMRLYAERFSLTMLPADLPIPPWPVALVTLKNRTLSPVVERFLECTREVAKSFSTWPQALKL